MDSRRKMVLDVLRDGLSISESSRRAGVSRKTGRKWVARARAEGVAELSERSRAPKVVACRTDHSIELALAEAKRRYPEWGAKKLVVRLKLEQSIDLPVRTADRILARLGLTMPRTPVQEAVRFERPYPGALLQMDFKGLPTGTPYALLTVLDDHGRFCYHFAPVPDRRAASVKAALWDLFAEHGLPDEMLMDNGDCWGASRSHAPSPMGAWLMRLGIKVTHGRPMHPQTQGKVERFHRTAKLEMGARLIRATAFQAAEECEWFVSRYNWERPHEALGGEVPGSKYSPWPRKRPSTPPIHEIPEGACTRKVDQNGFLFFQGREYLIGKGLYKEAVVLQPEDLGIRIYYAGFPLAYLQDLTQSPRSRRINDSHE